METTLTNAPTFAWRLVRLQPAVVNVRMLNVIIDAETNPANVGYPPRAAWCSVLRGLRVQFDTPGFVEDATAFLGGETTARTYADIARAFDVSASTVKNHWVATGMPKDGPPYDLIEILSWRLAADRIADINHRRTF